MNMKKIAFLPALFLTVISSAFAQEQDLSASASYAYESEFIFRGFEVAQDTFTPSAEGRIITDSTTIYAGVRTALPTKKLDNKRKMHEYYLGTEFSVMDNMKIDVGVSHYQFLPYTDDSATEGMLGLSFDTILNPAIYVYADSEGDMFTFEASAGHAFVLDQKSAIMVTAYLGQTDFYVGSSYAGLMIDYSYSFTRYARFTVGGRVANLDPDAPYQGNDDEMIIEGDTKVWWGVSFTAGF